VKTFFENVDPVKAIVIVYVLLIAILFCSHPELFGKFAEYLWCQTNTCIRVYPTP